MGDGTALIALAGVLAGSAIAAIPLAVHATRYRGWQQAWPDQPTSRRVVGVTAVRRDQQPDTPPAALPARSFQP
jgi:hypothetical protein